MNSGGGFGNVQKALRVIRLLLLEGLESRANELQEALNSCFRLRIEFKHQHGEEMHSSSSTPGTPYFFRTDLSASLQQQGEGILQGDARMFATTVAGGRSSCG
ncbi:MAG TPA: hypothetical protein PKE27_11540 [Povalibacter sp.]|uniref:hypothetical protein n=1 Tax=Povalibacter sp. TaxID=1962978 RepID=UPI002BC0D5E0|nr:hypothetical protein [Povalibacter sp.]HMN45203.1 hypothetical protein [Povalibacter sp.]